MSSHHVVREKQEPALLVLSLDNFDDELLGQLLEWSPTVIAIPDTAEQLDSRGIKIDWIITDDVNSVEQSDIKVMAASGTKPFIAALNYLTRFEYTAVNIVTAELDLPAFLPYAQKINLVIYSGVKRIFPVLPGFSKWKSAGEVVEVLGPAEEIHVSGLEKIRNNCYKTTNDGVFSLTFKGDMVFLSEEV